MFVVIANSKGENEVTFIFPLLSVIILTKSIMASNNQKYDWSNWSEQCKHKVISMIFDIKI